MVAVAVEVAAAHAPGEMPASPLDSSFEMKTSEASERWKLPNE